MKTLRPYKHKKLDFFITDDIEICSFRDEIASMEHPFFALKAGDTKTREYKNGKITIKVEPTSSGLATIFDKDIWIYAISKLQEAMNNHQSINRIIGFTPYDFFITTNRAKSGRAYEDLEKALSRLSGTRIKTNIVHSDNEQETIGFGLIDNWRIIRNQKGKLETGMIEITLPDWLYQAITKTKVLQISPDYFRIRKAIDRRLYEIARKHCGIQYKFSISIDKLHLKTGSASNKREFKRLVKNLCLTNDLPDYEIKYNCIDEKIIFKNRKLIKKTYKKNFNKSIDFSKNILFSNLNNNKIPKGFRK